jgi:hypothetical protein
MENTFFEAPEYPVLDRFKKCAKLFVKQAFLVLALLLLIRISEIGFYGYTLPTVRNSMLLIGEGICYTLIYFLKSLPILFVFYAIVFFSNIGGLALKICNYALFAIYLLIELLLARYFYQSEALLAEKIFVKGGVDFSKWFVLGFYWLGSVAVVLILLWLMLNAAKNIRFIDSAFSFFMIIAGLVLLLFGVPAVPDREENFRFKIMVPKSAYLIEKSFTLYFEEEPKVDLYKENYID